MKPAKFTRYEHKRRAAHTDTPAVTPAPVAPKRLPIAAHRPITRKAFAGENNINVTADLHAESNIPVSILRKALPLRFAQMKFDGDELAFN
ncbi:MAG: hypothetical protein AB8B47_05105 [Roseobacter sp.]